MSNVTRLKEKIAAPKERNPMSIWLDPTLTKAHKMLLLYDLCSELLHQPPVKAAERLSTSVTYVCTEWFTPNDSIAWFFREPKEGLTPPTKHHTDEEQPGGRKADSNKKRKIREVKKIDVASLLNTFS